MAPQKNGQHLAAQGDWPAGEHGKFPSNNPPDIEAQAGVNAASRVKPPRRRATQSEMAERAEFLIAYAEEHGPVTVRGLYYQAGVQHVPGIDKSDGAYDKVQRQVLNLRREGRIAYPNISDMTRWMRKPRSFNGVEDALAETARLYRKSLWTNSDAYVEVWCEKDALAGVSLPITSAYDVPLMVARGFGLRDLLGAALTLPCLLFLLSFRFQASAISFDN